MPPVFDHLGSLHRMGNDEQLFGEMVGFLRDDAPVRLREIQSGLGEANWKQAQRSAHSLKGLVSNFGAARAQAAAARLESLIQQQKRSPEVELAISDLESAVNELQEALSPYCPAAGSSMTSA
jgi:HPt (histidine-containing phosphotransfer) domain-containing protein